MNLYIINIIFIALKQRISLFLFPKISGIAQFQFSDLLPKISGTTVILNFKSRQFDEI